MVKEFANIALKYKEFDAKQLEVLTERFTVTVEKHGPNIRGLITRLDYSFEYATKRRYYTAGKYARKNIPVVSELYDAAMEYHASLQNVTK